MHDGDGQDRVTMVGRVLRPGRVVSVEIVPGWDLTGADTNSRTYTLYNRGSDGDGTAAIATLELVSGTDLEKFVAKALTITASAAALAIGDILEFESLHVGSGLPDPGGRLIVQQSLAS